MNRAAKSFLGFSAVTFFLFGFTSNDNKYTGNASRGSAMMSLCGNTHIYTANSLSTLAMKSNGIGMP
jgi:hypothetical protein